MRRFMFYVFAAFVLTTGFSSVSAGAQKSKPVVTKPAVTAKDTKSTAAGTETKPTTPKTTVQTTAPAAAAAAHTPSAWEQAVLDEINLVRKEPKKYIQHLEDYKKLFKGKTVYLSKSLWIETMEGTAVIDEAINYLKNLTPVGAYSFSDGLNKVVSIHLKDLIENPSLSHKGKDGSDLMTRLSRGGTVGGSYAENIAFSVENAREAVLMMIIDDGFKSRSHRKNIFSPTFKVIGIACGKAKSGQGLCIADFAEGFSDGTRKSGVREF